MDSRNCPPHSVSLQGGEVPPELLLRGIQASPRLNWEGQGEGVFCFAPLKEIPNSPNKSPALPSPEPPCEVSHACHQTGLSVPELQTRSSRAGMSETLLVLGSILGLTLSGLLVCTIAFSEFKFWPTPGKGTWQSFLFWGLFRSVNTITLVMAFVCWQPWQEFLPARRAGAGSPSFAASSTAWRSMLLAAPTSTAAATGSLPAASTPGRAIRSMQPPSRHI